MEPGSGRQGTFTVRRFLIAFALGAALLLPVGASADSRPNLILTVRLVPGTVSAGQPALAVAVFHNVGATPLPHVVVSLHFPKGFTIKNAEACTAVPGSKVDVDCTLGDIPSGASKNANVIAVVDRNLPQGENVNVQFALRVGAGRPKPILTGASAQVLASTDGANRGSCLLAPRPLSATLGAQVTALPAPPTADPSLNVPCTPLSVAVSPAPFGQGYKTKHGERRLAQAGEAGDREADVRERDASRREHDRQRPGGQAPEHGQPEPAVDLLPGHRQEVRRPALQRRGRRSRKGGAPASSR